MFLWPGRRLGDGVESALWVFFIFILFFFLHLSPGLGNAEQPIHVSFWVADSFPNDVFAQAGIRMNWLPLTPVSVIITGNSPESHNSKNRAGGEATRLLRTFLCHVFPFPSVPFHPIPSHSVHLSAR